MAVTLVTGMSGTGKSTVLNRLKQRGYRVVDTDVGGWIEHIPLPDGTGMEPQWREDRIDGTPSARQPRNAIGSWRTQLRSNRCSVPRPRWRSTPEGRLLRWWTDWRHSSARLRPTRSTSMAAIQPKRARILPEE